jgi:hypothetical protein
MRRLVLFLAVALIIFFIITQPRNAADVVQSIGATVRGAASSFTTFFTELV